MIWRAALVAVGLSGCAAEHVRAPQDEIAAARYMSPEPPYVALLTTIKTPSGNGYHSALLVNGAQKAIYDPAGTFTHKDAPEFEDVHFGYRPEVARVYRAYHTRDNYALMIQRLPVSRAFADQVLARMLRQGASPKAHCTINTAEILQDFPAFGDIPRTYWPGTLRDAFARLPGIETEIDTGDSYNVVRVKVER